MNYSQLLLSRSYDITLGKIKISWHFIYSTENPSLKQCVQDCETSSEYKPVCGSDNITYINPGKFVCARNCGVSKYAHFLCAKILMKNLKFCLRKPSHLNACILLMTNLLNKSPISHTSLCIIYRNNNYIID